MDWHDAGLARILTAPKRNLTGTPESNSLIMIVTAARHMLREGTCAVLFIPTAGTGIPMAWVQLLYVYVYV
jgi:hypothetical protein